ncbi:pirin family protein [Ammoniphilus sp. YIM 78166]|uniref:pirin family protein n=1 Tax=Ammoniphilus sp. YIM 78166 TaxID=1644106 RepID=UPI00351838D8
MIQLWVNLPKQHKMTPPRYQTLSKEQMGHVDLPDQGGTVRIIAGEFDGVKGPARTFTPVHLFDITFKAHGKARFAQLASFNTAILVLSGKVKFNDTELASEGDFILFNNEEGDILLEGTTDHAMVIVLSGQPINEPMVQYGLFVMNSKEEIKQAYEDFQAGKLGNPDF